MNKRFLSRKLSIIVAAVVVVAGAGVAAFYFLNRAPEVGSTLRPTEPITIAGHRYISPCRTLPETDVADIYGAFGPDGYVAETYLDRSVSKDELKDSHALVGSGELSCIYYLENKENASVKVSIAQFATNAEAQEEWKSAVKLGDGSYERMLKDFKSTLQESKKNGKTNDELTKQSEELIDFMEKTLPRAKREGGTTVDGLDKSILFVKDRGSFEAVYENTLVTLTYEKGSANPFDTSRKINAKELPTVLGPINRSFSVIFANMAKPDLSQEISPTLRGNSPTVGETKILEPCELLDRKTFADSYGKDNNNGLIYHETVNTDVTTDTMSKDGYPLLEANNCLRRYKEGDDRGYIDFQLYYAKDPSAATKFLDARMGKPSEDKELSVLQTSADYTVLRRSSIGSMKLEFLMFRTGNYVGKVNITKSSDIDDVSVDDSVFIKTVDGLVTNIERFAK